jgi:hypothetical protein
MLLLLLYSRVDPFVGKDNFYVMATQNGCLETARLFISHSKCNF